LQYSENTTIDNGPILRHLNFTTENNGVDYTSLNFGESWDDCFKGKYKVSIDDLKLISPQEVWEKVKLGSSKNGDDYEYPNSCSDGTSFGCQLRCPTCRDTVIKYKEYGRMEETWDWVAKLLNDPQLNRLLIGCHGETFYNRHRINYLRSLTQEIIDKKEKIAICTNGLNLTPKMWDSLKTLKANPEVVDIRISLDAATKKTFAITRPTANWDKLINNIKYLSTQGLGQLALDFTVQTVNFRELVEFSKLANSLGCDSTIRPIYNWFWNEERFKEAAVWQKPHKLFPKFLGFLQEASKIQGCYSLYQLADYLPHNYWEQWDKQ